MILCKIIYEYGKSIHSQPELHTHFRKSDGAHRIFLPGQSSWELWNCFCKLAFCPQIWPLPVFCGSLSLMEREKYALHILWQSSYWQNEWGGFKILHRKGFKERSLGTQGAGPPLFRRPLGFQCSLNQRIRNHHVTQIQAYLRAFSWFSKFTIHFWSRKLYSYPAECTENFITAELSYRIFCLTLDFSVANEARRPWLSQIQLLILCGGGNPIICPSFFLSTPTQYVTCSLLEGANSLNSQLLCEWR